MYILNIAKAIKKMTVKELKGFIFENYHLRLGFDKENSYYSMKRRKKKIYKNRKKYVTLVTLSIISEKEKHKAGKTIRNNYLKVKSYGKSKL